MQCEHAISPRLTAGEAFICIFGKVDCIVANALGVKGWFPGQAAQHPVRTEIMEFDELFPGRSLVRQGPYMGGGCPIFMFRSLMVAGASMLRPRVFLPVIMSVHPVRIHIKASDDERYP